MSKTIEIFTDSSRFPDNLEKLARATACSRCTILVYDASDLGSKKVMESRVSEYGVMTLPALTLDGKLVPLDQLKGGGFDLPNKKAEH